MVTTIARAPPETKTGCSLCGAARSPRPTAHACLPPSPAVPAACNNEGQKQRVAVGRARRGSGGQWHAPALLLHGQLGLRGAKWVQGHARGTRGVARPGAGSTACRLAEAGALRPSTARLQSAPASPAHRSASASLSLSRTASVSASSGSSSAAAAAASPAPAPAAGSGAGGSLFPSFARMRSWPGARMRGEKDQAEAKWDLQATAVRLQAGTYKGPKTPGTHAGCWGRARPRPPPTRLACRCICCASSLLYFRRRSSMHAMRLNCKQRQKVEEGQQVGEPASRRTSMHTMRGEPQQRQEVGTRWQPSLKVGVSCSRGRNAWRRPPRQAGARLRGRLFSRGAVPGPTPPPCPSGVRTPRFAPGLRRRPWGSAWRLCTLPAGWALA